MKFPEPLTISLARCGGLSFIYGAQTIDSQAEMIRKVKKIKSGFVVCDSYLSPEHTLNEILRLKEDTGQRTGGAHDIILKNKDY